MTTKTLTFNQIWANVEDLSHPTSAERARGILQDFVAPRIASYLSSNGLTYEDGEELLLEEYARIQDLGLTASRVGWIGYRETSRKGSRFALDVLVRRAIFIAWACGFKLSAGAT